MVSPCPHTPACPPPVCLPPSLRPTAEPRIVPKKSGDPADAGDKSKLPGYETHISSIDTFTGSMSSAAQGVNAIRNHTPRFEGWDLAPMAGVPIVGLMFIDRFNRISDTWKDSAGILHNLLKTDTDKLATAARNYRAAERPPGAK
ncbi:MAG TPA: hypothetical protein VFV66_06750 [Nonomuraea sp.]|nr:hypothetical protein [Nonomuraea sp.]